MAGASDQKQALIIGFCRCLGDSVSDLRLAIWSRFDGHRS